MKKILSVILAVVILATVFPATVIPVSAADEITVREIVSGLEYNYIFDFNEGFAMAVRDAVITQFDIYGGKYGYIDRTGKEVITCEYDNAQEFSEGLAPVQKDGKWGFIDKTGKVVIPLEYDYAAPFSEGFASVEKDYKRGCIDKSGKIIIPIEYNYVGQFHGGLAVAKNDGKTGFIDKTGKIVIPFEYDHASKFSEGLAAVKKNNKWGYIDKTGEIVIPCEYNDWYDNFNNGMAIVGKDGKRGVIDKTGKIIIPLEYDFIGNYSDGLFNVGINGKYGYIDKTGIFVVPFGEYGFAYGFSEGLGRVRNVEEQGYKQGYIDNTGKIIVPLEYEDTNHFREGLAVVKKDGKLSILEIVRTTAASPSPQKVFVNGKEVEFDAYAINDNNYFKLRDIAYVLNGTEKQFEIAWDGENNAISLTSGKPYTEVGGEMKGKGAGSKTATQTTSKIYLDGEKLNLTAYTIDGNNYFKLSDIGQAFDFFTDGNRIYTSQRYVLGSEFASAFGYFDVDFKESIVQYWDTGKEKVKFETTTDEDLGVIFKINDNIVDIAVLWFGQIIVTDDIVIITTGGTDIRSMRMYIFDFAGNALFKTYYLNNKGMAIQGYISIDGNNIIIPGGRTTHGINLVMKNTNTQFSEYHDYLYQDTIYDYKDKNIKYEYDGAEIYIYDGTIFTESAKLLNKNEVIEADFILEYLGSGKFNKIKMTDNVKTLEKYSEEQLKESLLRQIAGIENEIINQFVLTGEFIWSPDNRYVAVPYANGRGTYKGVSVVDTQIMDYIILPHMEEMVKHLFPNDAPSLPSRISHTPIPCFEFIAWESDSKIKISFEWLGEAQEPNDDFDIYWGWYIYDLNERKIIEADYEID
jgi:hypothetical protein